jgi:hypothetical protein
LATLSIRSSGNYVARRLQTISFAPGQQGGVSVRYTDAKIIATRLTSLTNTPVVH